MYIEQKVRLVISILSHTICFLKLNLYRLQLSAKSIQVHEYKALYSEDNRQRRTWHRLSVLIHLKQARCEIARAESFQYLRAL